MLKIPSSTNGTKLPVQLCDSFVKDKRFESVKKTLQEKSQNLGKTLNIRRTSYYN